MSAAVAGTILHLETRRLGTAYGPFDVHVYRSLATGAPALAVARGVLGGAAPLLARVHSSCVTSEILGSCDCDCVEQLDGALTAIAAAGRGVLFYLVQEGRGAGLTAKVRDRMIVQASGERMTTFEAYREMGLARDCRSYEEVAFMASLLGIEAPLMLLTGNAAKRAELETAGVRVAGTTSCGSAASPFNAHYLRAKLVAGASAHARADTPAATLPEAVTYFDPFVPAELPGLVRTASYLVPIAVPGDAERRWLRLHAYFDLGAHHEWIVLTYGAPATRVPLLRVQPAPLLDRLPVDDAVDKRRWHATLRAFVRHGAGCALVRVAERDALAPPAIGASPVAARLLAYHLHGRARPIVDGSADAVLARGLAAHGVTLDAPLVLGDDDAC